MSSKSFYITNQENINEITTFVKHTTSVGNIRYAADVGHDDTVMTIVNATSIFDKNEFKEIVEDYMERKMDSDMKSYITDCLKNSDYFESVDYTQVLNVRRRYMSNRGGYNAGYDNSGNWFFIN